MNDRLWVTLFVKCIPYNGAQNTKPTLVIVFNQNKKKKIRKTRVNEVTRTYTMGRKHGRLKPLLNEGTMHRDIEGVCVARCNMLSCIKKSHQQWVLFLLKNYIRDISKAQISLQRFHMLYQTLRKLNTNPLLSPSFLNPLKANNKQNFIKKFSSYRSVNALVIKTKKIHTQTHARMHTHKHKRARTRTCTYKHTRTHTHCFKHMRTYVRTHARDVVIPQT
jgi:hypothetical protein